MTFDELVTTLKNMLDAQAAKVTAETTTKDRAIQVISNQFVVVLAQYQQLTD